MFGLLAPFVVTRIVMQCVAYVLCSLFLFLAPLNFLLRQSLRLLGWSVRLMLALLLRASATLRRLA
jgi:hypothetical protein